jgi:hypothetical protein
MLVTLCGLLTVLGAPAVDVQGQTADDPRVQTALKRAVARLREQVGSADSGEGALLTMALLKTGVPREAPEMKSGIDKILSHVKSGKYEPGNHHVYEAGIGLMALANADSKGYRSQIEAIAKYLISVQQQRGAWGYPGQELVGDTSITQYAVLGLWEASRSGVTVPRKVWDKVAAWHVATQRTDGSFSYHPDDPTSGAFQPGAVGGGGTHSMSVAGTASLYVARMHLYPDARDVEEVKARAGSKRRGKKFGVLEPADAKPEEAAPRAVDAGDPNYRATTRLSAIDKAINKGKEWLTEHFTVAPKANHDIYYLYGLERLAALADVKEFGTHDWYAEGATHLLGVQSPGGTWSDGCGEFPATALGILFLSKATAKMVARKERAPPERRFGGGLLVGGRGLPEDLNAVQADQGGVRVRKLKGPVDELLAELEKAESRQVESAQSALVESIATENPEALIGQGDRLLKLARDRRSEVRRTAFWALGRTNDLRVVPTLIAGLNDSDLDCMVEARNALRYISKKLDVREPPDDATSDQRLAAIALWKKWYLTVRPYDDRDDLGEAPAK